MPTVTANRITIAYETYGDPAGRPLVLIMGLASPMVFWPGTFCRMLADAGHYVIRFDNRDCGRSARMEALGVPDLTRIRAELRDGRPVAAPYTLADMAADTVGLLDGLGLAAAHVCGLSLGGMIAQQMAIDHPRRVARLISLMSTTGERDLPPTLPDARRAMLTPPPLTREAYQQHMVAVGRAFCADATLYDPELRRRLAGQAFDDGLYPEGFFRQMAALMTAGGRRAALASVRIPTLVIHGSEDTVLPPEHGHATAEAIPGACLQMVPGLGHGLEYPTLWPALVDAIARHTRAERV